MKKQTKKITIHKKLKIFSQINKLTNKFEITKNKKTGRLWVGGVDDFIDAGCAERAISPRHFLLLLWVGIFILIFFSNFYSNFYSFFNFYPNFYFFLIFIQIFIFFKF